MIDRPEPQSQSIDSSAAGQAVGSTDSTPTVARQLAATQAIHQRMAFHNGSLYAVSYTHLRAHET